MIPRLLQLPDNESYFLFGPRGVGKTTLLKNLLLNENTVFINLLSAEEENRFARNPDELTAIVKALPIEKSLIVIDEIQKLPKLLDIVHDLIETTDKNFILTGSSARKLKQGGANLLAGRAFVYHLFPFSYLEVIENFQINESLSWGMLPKVFEYISVKTKQLYLEAYTNTYLKEEIWAEKFIKKLEPFRHFLEVAAQGNGKIINYSNIAHDVGVTDMTVKDYYSILEDTMIGFFLNSFEHSFRKRLNKSAKFYFFDIGVVRTLTRQLRVPIQESTSYYGELFEQFIILQCMMLGSYFHSDYRFSYLATKDGAEVDLVVERPGQKLLFIEIKSSVQVELRHLTTLKKMTEDIGNCEAVCFSRDTYAKQYDTVTVYPWTDGIKKFFGEDVL